jgi:capsular polysaccharide transport system permease protein
MAAARPLRSPLAITLTVWKALFLRGVLTRVGKDRTGGVRLLLEPMAHIAFLMFLFVEGFKNKHVSGIDTGFFVMLGVLSFFFPRNMVRGGMTAVGRSDYTYRQVRPIDVLISRILVDSVLGIIVFAVVLSGAAFVGIGVTVADPLGALIALGGLWVAGMGLALTFSVLANLSFWLGRLMRLIMRVMYFFSGVLMPSAGLPHGKREYVLLNPLFHGVESVRLAFSSTYVAAPSIDVVYIYQFGVVMVFLGLAMQVAFRDKLVAT